jgi:hypothetical protein
MHEMIELETAQRSFAVGIFAAGVMGFFLRDAILRMNRYFDKRDAERAEKEKTS